MRAFGELVEVFFLDFVEGLWNADIFGEFFDSFDGGRAVFFLTHVVDAFNAHGVGDFHAGVRRCTLC